MEQNHIPKEDEECANVLLELKLEPIGCLYISNHRLSCALFACPVVQQIPSSYCCSRHEEVSTQLSEIKLPLQVFDGFLDQKHRDTLCTGSLLVQSKGVKTGIPTLDDDKLFSDGSLGSNASAKRDYLFFRSTKATFKALSGTTLSLRWKANSRRKSVLEGKELGTRSISIRQHGPNTSDAEKWEVFKIRDGRYWTLYLYDYEGKYLYCLSYDEDPPKVPFIKTKPADPKPEQEEDDEEKEAPEKKKSKLSGGIIQKTDETTAAIASWISAPSYPTVNQFDFSSFFAFVYFYHRLGMVTAV